jgi:6-pyruvoyltetrahydropterin/6-carboxytetrahydropterin synthase
MPYQSTKRFGPISTGHRNWRAQNHCGKMHGYGRYIQFTFQGALDEFGWVMDFSGLKAVRKFLEDNWDHKMLIASDDPKLDKCKELHEEGLIDLNIMDVSKGWAPAIEGSCKFVFDHVQPVIHHMTNGRVHIAKIEIWEHENNSAIFIPEEKDFQRCTIKANQIK